MDGFSLFGGREAKVTPGEGPEVRVTAVALFGAVEIQEKKTS